DGDEHGAPPKLRRRPMLIAVSIVLTAVGALLAAYLLTEIAGTNEVVAVREGVSRGEQITADDLVMANVSYDSAVRPLPWSDARSLEGMYAQYDMAPGSIVTRESVIEELDVPQDQSVVGLYFEPGRMPSDILRNGDVVRVVASGEDPTKPPTSYPGYVMSTRPATDGRGTIVDVRVQASQAPQVAAASGTGLVSLVLDARDRGEQDASPAGPSSTVESSASPTSTAESSASPTSSRTSSSSTSKTEDAAPRRTESTRSRS
ncbi:SAF domain-containing protein, partial [Janibacter melonis]|uniref:SAF domain-containing protein n=1 Tax=Janibacter melonis TaxID=262209 RepID=UPI001CD887C6